LSQELPSVFKAIRISVLLFILFFVAMSSWLTQARSTDWNNSLWVKIYPINADGSDASEQYIDRLRVEDFAGIEEFIDSEASRYGKNLSQPLRIELGNPISEQPPQLPANVSVLNVMLWSLKTRWWASSTAGEQDSIEPDVRMFVRYHSPELTLSLENSVGLQKGMIGIVNAYASRRQRGINNVIIAHEFLHTLGATDKYDAFDGQPHFPDGIADPDRKPLYPQRIAEIMGGRIALARDDAVVPKNLDFAMIGPLTASEINLTD